MKTITSGSSAPYQTALDWSVPSQWQPQLRNDLDRLQAYDAKEAEQKALLDAGRKKVSSELVELVLTVINDIRAKLEAEVSTNRRNAIECYMRIKQKHYGLEMLPDGTVKLPNRKLIKRVLKSQGL